MLAPRQDTAARHIELLTGSADTPCCFRLLRGAGEGWNYTGRLAAFWPAFEEKQREGWQVFVIVNEGGHDAASITRVRALFVDGDGVPTPTTWHAAPDFIVRRDPTHWHAYWLVGDLPKGEFKAAQRRLAAFYGTDRKVCDLPRVMRLAGTLHLKDLARPHLVMIEADAAARGPGNARSAVELLAGLPVATAARRATAQADGAPVSLEIVREMLGCIDPGCERDEWRDTIAAIRAAPVPDDEDEEERRALAQEWSAGEYAPLRPLNYTGVNDVDRVFDDMLPSEPGDAGKVHFGSLVAKARAAGYTGPSRLEQAPEEKWGAALANLIQGQQSKAERDAAFMARIAAASGGALQPMPERDWTAEPSPEFVEYCRQVIAAEHQRGEELARMWGLK